MSETAICSRRPRLDPLIGLRDRLLIAFYQDGNALAATSEKFGLSTGHVHNIITKYERLSGVMVLRRRQGHSRSDSDIRSLIAFYQDGNTLVVTGKKFGFSASSVRKIIFEYEERNRVLVLRGRARSDTDMRPLIAFYQDGNTLVATGKKFGFTASRVHQIITEYEQRYGVVVLRRRRGRPRRDIDIRPLIAYYREGNTLDATGKKFGFTGSRVHQIIIEFQQRYGVVLLRDRQGRSVGE